MTRYGYSLMCELYHPNDLLALAARAEEVGFDFLTISDHIHPWLYSHHQSPYEGKHYNVHDARVFTLPDEPPPVHVAVTHVRVEDVARDDPLRTRPGQTRGRHPGVD
jgi:alkanesulfonate monooxygenase SsuD/methylene tetrahydromethanopterin reductase-like flavin-dependent oxidoreductase (luciferase family)